MNSWVPRDNRTTSPAWCSAASSPLRQTENRNLLLPLKVSHNQAMKPRELANEICQTLQRNGYQALLVGGCVRDLLLGREPADYDVATDATPDQVVGLFPDSIAVGAQFGVILIPRSGLKVEVATFRSDVGYKDGRHPDRKSTRLNSSHGSISYAVFCLKKKKH